ncbi:MAG TPA: DUF1266 domain-containing protein [Polyangiaceae bacterium]
MGYPDHQLWALAVGAPVICTEGLDVSLLGGHRHDDPNTVGWCRYALKTFYGVESRPQLEQALTFLFQRAPGPMAWDLSRAVAVAGWGVWAGFFQELESWQIIMTAAAKVQREYTSWDAFADDYESGRSAWAKGAPYEPTARGLAWLRNDAQSPWKRLAWKLDLGITLFDAKQAKVRFKRTTCPTCGGPKQRPSPTAYVYCDYCGALCDFDFAKACEKPLERPGPVYVQLLSRIQPSLDDARARCDVDAFRTLQRQLYDAYVEAAPGSCSPRVRDPAYRAKYVAAMAEGAVVRAFDAQSREHEAAVARATKGLAFMQIAPGVIRVATQPFEALLEAVFAQQEHDAQLFDARGIWDLNPDGATRAVQRRAGVSMFVQGWLPMLEEAQAKALVERAGLRGEYVEADPVQGETRACGNCGGPTLVLPGAKQVVCEHCGRKLDVVAMMKPC